jgi:hypothetical protein
MSVARGNPRVRAFHTSPNAPAVDIYIDGTLAIPNLAFGQVSDYLALQPGNHSLRIFPAGTSGQGQEVLNAELEGLKVGEDYTAVAIDRLEHLHAMLLHDTTPPPSAGHAKVRVLHASPDAPAVDIAATGGPLLFKNVGFRHVTDFSEVPAGMVDLEVRPAGQTETLMVVPDYTLAEGTMHTFVALGLLQGQPAFMIMPLVTTVEMRMPA